MEFLRVLLPLLKTLEYRWRCDGLHPSHFNIMSGPKGHSQMRDLYKAILGNGINMKKCIK